jgi:hypothetical protein
MFIGTICSRYMLKLIFSCSGTVIRYVGVIWFVFYVLQPLPIDLHDDTCVALKDLQ